MTDPPARSLDGGPDSGLSYHDALRALAEGAQRDPGKPGVALVVLPGLEMVAGPDHIEASLLGRRPQVE